MNDGILDGSVLDNRRVWSIDKHGLKFICLKGMPMENPDMIDMENSLIQDLKTHNWGGFYTLYEMTESEYLLVDTYAETAVAPVTILADGKYRVETGMPFWTREQLVALKIQLDY